MKNEKTGTTVKFVIINLLIGAAEVFLLMAAVWIFDINSRGITFFFILLGLVLILITVNIVTSVIVVAREFEKFSVVLKKIEEGDLSVKILEDKGVFKRIADAINRLVKKLRGIIGKVESSTNNILGLAENFSSSTQEINASSEEISSTVQQIARGVEQQAERTVETSRIMENMSVSIQDVAQKSEDVLEVAKAAKDAAEKGKHSVDETITKMDDIVKVTNDAKSSILELVDFSEKIGEVVNIITEIADETNLLALNAAIEAARAGDAGRGFAVVADEVRKLAEGSSGAANEIAKLVSDIQEKTGRVGEAVSTGVKETEAGKKVVEESGAALFEINTVVTKAVTLANEIFELAKIQAKDTDKVVKAVEEIATVAEETAAGTQQASASTQQQTASMEEIAAQAQELAQTAELLREAVHEFKLEEEKAGG